MEKDEQRLYPSILAFRSMGDWTMSGVHSEANRPMLLSSGLRNLSFVRLNQLQMTTSDHAQLWTCLSPTIEAT